MYGIAQDTYVVQSLLNCPEVYMDMVIDHLTDCGTEAVWNSSLIQESPFAREVATGAHSMGAIPVEVSTPSFNAFQNVVAGADCPDPCQLTASEMIARKLQFNKKWSAENLVSFNKRCSENDDVLQRFFDEVSLPYWRKFYGDLALAMMIGVYNNLSGDAAYAPFTVFDPTVDPTINNGFTTLNNVTLNNSNKLTACRDYTGMIVHRDVFTDMQNAGLIECRCADDGVSQLYFLDGKAVTVVDDSTQKALLEAGGAAALAGGTNSNLSTLGYAGAANTYLSICYRPGAIHYGEGCHPRALEMDSDVCANGGDGDECMMERRRFVMHPEGLSFNWDAATSSGGANSRTPSGIDLGNPAFYSPVYQPDRMPFKFIITTLN